MKAILMSVFFIVLTGCASHANYQAAKGSGYGYKDVRVSETEYRVEYKTANTNTNTKKAQDFALLRAAELTIEQGYDWFVVTKRETVNDREKTAPTPSLGSHQVVSRSCGLLACRTRVDNIPDMDTSAGDVDSESKASLEIHLGKGVRPVKEDAKAGSLETYDARETVDGLRAKLK